MNGKAIRFNRLFGGGQNAAIVAVDHGAEFGSVPGLDDLCAALENLDAADGILLNPGMLHRCAGFFGRKEAPLLILRVTWTTAYCFQWKYSESHTCAILTPEQALATGADFIMACRLLRTESETVDRDNVRIFAEIAAAKDRAGVPLIGELYPAGAEAMPTTFAR